VFDNVPTRDKFVSELSRNLLKFILMGGSQALKLSGFDVVFAGDFS